MESEALLEQIRSYYLEFLPFNKVLGIEIDHLDYDTGEAVTRFSMQENLIGNSVARILHGGVTASVLDLTGGLSGLISCVKQYEFASHDTLYEKLTAMATVDMRVDYLRPGRGEAFTCKSRVIRAGSRIVVSKMDLFNETDRRIATGTATYIIDT